MYIEKKQEKTISSNNARDFFNYTRRTKPRSVKRNELVDFVDKHFDCIDDQDPSVSHIRILNTPNPREKNLFVVPDQVANTDRLTEKHEHIAQFIKILGTYCTKIGYSYFPFEEMVLEIEKAQSKHADLLKRRENTRAQNKTKKKNETIKEAPKKETEADVKKYQALSFKNHNVNKEPSPEKVNHIILRQKTKEEKTEELKNGSIFLYRLKAEERNTLLHDFIQSKYTIFGNSHETKTWDVIREPVEDKMKGALHLSPILSTGNPFILDEFKFVKKFTEKYKDEITDFKQKAQIAADLARKSRPYI